MPCPRRMKVCLNFNDKIVKAVQKVTKQCLIFHIEKTVLHFNCKEKFEEILRRVKEHESFYLATDTKSSSRNNSKDAADHNSGNALLIPAADMSPKQFVDSSAHEPTNFKLTAKLPKKTSSDEHHF